MAEQQLPIFDIIPALKKALQERNTIILQAPPGAGKSTILPLQLLQEAWLKGQKILMLEPRRLAARSVAQRMAQLMGEKVGATVGYRVRFENQTSSQTRIEVLTEGILTRMLQHDNALEGVGLVIFDEFHERSLQADLALALSREAQAVLREDLRLLIMSATLEGDELSRLLGGAPVIRSEGRQYPVKLRYLAQEEREPITRLVARAVRLALREEEGDVLAFLPGSGEIRRTAELLEETEGVEVYPLYGDLPQQEQQQAILPHPKGKRKIVLATSIAETSLTIEGIGVVVDSGYSRIPRFDPQSGLTRLETVKVSADTADQRAGRAGRLGPGVAYRLWAEPMQYKLQPHRQPEILEADLSPATLELANWGVSDMQALAWLTPPPAGALAGAKELLQRLESMEEGRITPKGKELLHFPTHPRLANLLLKGAEWELPALAAEVAALLEERDILPPSAGSDLSLRVEALRRKGSGGARADRNLMQRVERLAAHWRRLLRTAPDAQMPADTDVGRLLAVAYPERIARREGASGRYRLSNGRLALLPEHDPLMHQEWLAVARLDSGRQGQAGRIFVAAPLNPADVLDMAQEKEVLEWDAHKGELMARSEIRLGDILVEISPLAQVPEAQRLAILCGAVRAEGLDIFSWTGEVRQWQARVLSLRQWRPEEEWPDVSETGLLAMLEDWLTPYLMNVRKREDFARLKLQAMLEAMLPWPQQQALERLAPEKVSVPSGSQIRLQYQADGSAPVLAVRLQEMFGQLETPAVNEGRTSVLVHLLSPAYRPVQVTQDMRSFWESTYKEVRKDLRGRYPKHFWPEDPFTAEAVRGVKRRK
ncbi:ATP-dependent helicase HrpB [Nafulsella turpanensis]|uniref:ATP-dependent helicase HrpB n=1 Tax=Nafulsella turpanensis TaxID=1265690 RepID=UPI0004775D63|nr:ATP-dependent helicase HrpB [Nafulsella turpanensis]